MSHDSRCKSYNCKYIEKEGMNAHQKYHNIYQNEVYKKISMYVPIMLNYEILSICLR